MSGVAQCPSCEKFTRYEWAELPCDDCGPHQGVKCRRCGDLFVTTDLTWPVTDYDWLRHRRFERTIASPTRVAA